MKLLDLQDIIRAQERIQPYINETPVFTSSLLNAWLGHEIYFKAEGFQKVGAFKSRGACNTVVWLIENNIKPRRIVANSSGNHAQAVAWAARLFDIPAAIYMPQNASTIKIQATASYGAEVILCKSRSITDEKVREASREEGTFWIPPFNHEKIIAGQGTAVFEAIHEIGQVDAVFAPCGGGGLLSGSLVAARALSPGAEVIGAEPLSGNDAAESLRKNTIQRLPAAPDTLADGARTLSVGDITFEYLKQLDEMYEIGESQIRYWTQWLTHLLKISVEPTSALAMEAAKQWMAKQPAKKKVLIVLSGGNTDQATYAKIWEKDLLGELPG